MKTSYLITIGILALSGCSITEKERIPHYGSVTLWDQEAYEDLLALPLWEKSVSHRSEDTVALEHGLIRPVALSKALEACLLLADDALVSISNTTAKNLIGEDYTSPKEIVRQVIRAKKYEIQEFEEHRKTFPEKDSDYRDYIEENQMEIATLQKKRYRLAPYLCRAVAFQNCGTGGFSADASDKEVWTHYGALGHGEFAKYNHPVIVFLPSQPQRSSFSYSVAE